MNSSNNSQQIFAINVLSQPANAAAPTENFRRRFKKNTRQNVVDIIVVLVALPMMLCIALLLEANTRGDWLVTTQTRLTVLGLGIALAVVCLAVCMYITSRIGGKMWSGAIPSSDGSGPCYSYYNSRMTAAEMNDLPPSYDVVMGFDIPPPPYHAIIIDVNNMKHSEEVEKCSKFITIQHI